MKEETIAVRMGEIRFSYRGVLACFALGSCVAAALYDPVLGLGGVAHIVLPGAEPPGSSSPGRYAQSAVHLLMEGMANRGASLFRCRTYLVGGAHLLKIRSNGLTIGEQNIASVRELLRTLGMVQLREDVGGTRGRTMYLEVTTGQVTAGRSGQESTVL